ncbi:hypothetical protein TRVL_02236 [Trypanosoma vivax]|nr:hypothetical protein TRVL_02236 [Trypanosoma vivax]
MSLRNLAAAFAISDSSSESSVAQPPVPAQRGAQKDIVDANAKAFLLSGAKCVGSGSAGSKPPAPVKPSARHALSRFKIDDDSDDSVTPAEPQERERVTAVQFGTMKEVVLCKDSTLPQQASVDELRHTLSSTPEMKVNSEERIKPIHTSAVAEVSKRAVVMEHLDAKKDGAPFFPTGATSPPIAFGGSVGTSLSGQTLAMPRSSASISAPAPEPNTPPVSGPTKPKRNEHIKFMASLYYNGMERMKRVEKRLQDLRSARDDTLLTCSFKPEITKFAQKMERVGKVPHCYEANTHLRQRMLLEAWGSKPEVECSPIPAISKGSERIVQRVRSQSAHVIPVSERLHLDSSRRRREREESAQKPDTTLRRRPSEVKALIARFEAAEAKRQLNIERMREDAESSVCVLPVRANGDEVVKRLLEPTPGRRRKAYVEVEQPFAPQIRSISQELGLRARRRRLQQWYYFWRERTEEGQVSLEDTDGEIVQRINDILQLAGLDASCSIDDFCNALNKSEKINGVHRWHSSKPPVRRVESELTFAPVIHSRPLKPSSCSSVYERLSRSTKIKRLCNTPQVVQEVDASEVKSLGKCGRRSKTLCSPALDCLKDGECQSVGNSKPTRSLSSSCQVPSAPAGVSDCQLVELSFVSLSSMESDERSTHTMMSARKICSDSFTTAEEAQHIARASSASSEAQPLSTAFHKEKESHEEPLMLQSYSQPFVDTEDSAFAPPAAITARRARRRAKTVRRSERLAEPPLSTDVLLECALGSCSSWSSGLAGWRLNRLKRRRRLRMVGKLLYQNM